MLKTIIRREILEYLKSAKFLIGLLIAVILAAASTFINVQDYAMRHQDYLDAKKALKSNGFEISVFREPQVLSTLVRGKDRDMGDQLKMTVMSAPGRLTGYGDFKKKKSPSFAGFSAVDFAFLVRVILSLLVVFLSFNSVSEEKANGTLKLALANSLPRDKLLLGKLLGGLAVVLGSLIVAALLSFLILMSNPAVSLSSGDVVRIAAMLAVSALFLSAFFSLGLFISVKTSRPAVTLMILLQAWIFLVIIYPNLSVTLAENLYPLPSEELMAQQHTAVNERFHDDIQKASLDKNPVTDQDRLRFNETWAKVAAEQSKIEQEFSRRQTAQMRLAEFLSALSPAALFDQVMNRMSRTDIREYERFVEGADRLWRKHVERSSLRYTDEAAFKKTSLPDFTYRSDSAAEAVASGWLQELILALFILIFFALAHTSFLRKDLR
jgi:ABC-type transport system involved in multi-copper enzyme maturation permease subunit